MLYRLLLKEMTMANPRLLRAVCTIALLAAAPAFAQTNTPASGTPDTNNAAAPAPTAGHTMHHSGMTHHRMHAATKAPTSQDAAVDRLNEQSFQAAQQGQSFTGPSGAMTMPAGNTMPSGKM
jgi:hypothetical protein